MQKIGNVYTNLFDEVSKQNINLEEVSTYYDGTPMSDTKVDGRLYMKNISDNKYYRQVLPNWGENFLNVDTMADLRALDDYNLLLVKAGYYKGVTLLGYYNKGEYSLNYLWNNVQGVDDGGSVINVGGGSFEAQFGKEVSVLSFGAKADGITDDYHSILNALNYNNGNLTILGDKHKISRCISITNVDINIKGDNTTISYDDVNGLFDFKSDIYTDKIMTSNYTSNTGDVYLNDMSGIKVGDLLHLTSSDLLSDVRDYYFKGGIFEIIDVKSNYVVISTPMHYDLDYRNITRCRVYKPIKLNIEGVKELKSTLELFSNYAISVHYASNPKIINLNSYNSKIQLNFRYCYNTLFDNTNVFYSQNKEYIDIATSGDTYGYYLYSCNGFKLINSSSVAGQVSFTTSGREPNYNIHIDNCNLKGEKGSRSIGFHQNTINAEISNCDIYGFKLAGKVKMSNIRDLKYNNTDPSALITDNDLELTNFIFENCEFNNVIQALRDYMTLTSKTRYLNSVIFDNCKGVHFYDGESASYPYSIIINSITIRNSANSFLFRIFKDTLNKLVVNNSALTINNNTYKYLLRATSTGRVVNIELNNCYTINNQTSVSSGDLFRLTNSDNFIINNLTNLDSSTSQSFITEGSIVNLSIINSDLSQSARYLLNTSATNLYVNNSILRHRTSVLFFGTIRNSSYVLILNTNLQLNSNIEYNGITNWNTLNSNKYRIVTNSNGLETYYKLNDDNTFTILDNSASLNSNGLVKQSTPIANATSADATDLETALVLINELKAKLNAKLEADRASGQQAT